ncbi:MAG: acetone carboxylase subunit gamma [Pseudomonadota bacterium]
MGKVNKDLVRQLIDGTIGRGDAHSLLRLARKDPERFQTYLEVLQERVPWEEKILMRISDHLYIVCKGEGLRIVKCDCGHEFGDYRSNWKLGALLRVRETAKEFEEVYYPAPACPEPEWQEIREFYCPGCVAQLAVEVVPPGYPIVFEMLPDLDRFYRDYLGTPLPDEKPEWFDDRTFETTAAWAGGKS